jgi:hypothetical protein
MRGSLTTRRADLAACARHVIDHACRQAGVAQHFEQQPAAPGRVGRSLEDDRVAGHQRRADRSACQRKRKVERRDHRPGTVRLQHRPVATDKTRQRIVRQRAVETFVGLHLVAVPREQIGGLLHLAERLHAVLADFERDRGADLVDPLLDQCRHPPQQADPFAPRRRRPAAECTDRRRHRIGPILCRAAGKAAQKTVTVDRRANLEQRLSRPRSAIDPLRKVTAEPAANARQRRVEPLVQFGRRIEHRRVGQAKGLGAHGRSLLMVYRRDTMATTSRCTLCRRLTLLAGLFGPLAVDRPLGRQYRQVHQRGTECEQTGTVPTPHRRASTAAGAPVPSPIMS